MEQNVIFKLVMTISIIILYFDCQNLNYIFENFFLNMNFKQITKEFFYTWK